MDLSIIIVSFNTRDLLRNCLQSLFDAQSKPPRFRNGGNPTELEFEVMVIDNGSTDGSVEMIQKEFLQTRIFKNHENRGFSQANNVGIKNALGRVLFFLNPDTTVIPGTIDLMYDYFRQDSKIGILAPQLLNPDGSVQRSGSKTPSFLRELLYYSGLWGRSTEVFIRVFDFGIDHDFSKIQEVGVAPGAAMMIKKEVIVKVGGWSERFFMYYEDIDLCQKIKRLGLKIVYFPKAKIYHHQGAAAKKVNEKAEDWLRQSALLYSKVWRKPWQTFLLASLFRLKNHREKWISKNYEPTGKPTNPA